MATGEPSTDRSNDRSDVDITQALLAHQDQSNALRARRATTVDESAGISPERARRRFRGAAPQTHRLPQRVMWGIVLLTASSMAVINFCTIWIISFVVEWKFSTMQAVVDSGNLPLGILTYIGTCVVLSSLCMTVIFSIAPSAGSSGAPENKGWLNGNLIPGFFTWKNMIVRQCATMLANMSGYPVGREGPTVTMGSNLAFLIAHRMALPYVRQWVRVGDEDSPNPDSEEPDPVAIIDEERFIHAKRIVCTVGGACGMAMLFDSPVGGIVYMFEEISSSSWPMEVTLRAFVGTTLCSVISRGMLNLCGKSTKEFVVYEFHPAPIEWAWSDMPLFITTAIVLGAFSAFHTRACLGVGAMRQRFMASVTKSRQSMAKIAEAVLFIALCAGVHTSIALLGKCFTEPEEASVHFVRFNCPEGEYNPVASLLLTTSEGAVKRLFSCRNSGEIHLGNECLAFVAYTMLNIFLTGIPVPSGNFTGSMLIGGMVGRIVGAAGHHFGYATAPSGIYAMIGSAAMLCGFKQMCVAVVVFISGCANDLNLVPPLMVSITVALLLNREINERGFDEEQILRKKIPYLPAEPPKCFDRAVAEDLLDQFPTIAEMAPEMAVDKLRDILDNHEELTVFPVVKTLVEDFKVCIGFTTRDRLLAAAEASESSTPRSSAPMRARESQQSDATEIQRLFAKAAVKRSMSMVHPDFAAALPKVEFEGEDPSEAMVPVARLTDTIPYTILEGMPAGRAYAPFAKLGVTAACVVSELGQYRGMITKVGLIEIVQSVEEGSHALAK